MSDLVERLRHPLWVHSDLKFGSPQLDQEATEHDLAEAAAEIERLTAERDAQKTAWAARYIAAEAKLSEARRALEEMRKAVEEVCVMDQEPADDDYERAMHEIGADLLQRFAQIAQ